ncbi:MAG: cytochrome c, partial [Aureliella sp.]
MVDDPTSSEGPAFQRTRPCIALRGLVLPPPLFALLALLLLTLLVCLGLLVVVALTYVDVDDTPQRSLDRGWAVLSGAALAWALANLYWSNLAAREPSQGNSVMPIAVFGHFAIAISCGLIALGIHAISVARASGTDPIVMDYSHLTSVSGDSDSVAVAVVTGDAEEGRKVFSTTCITCHGPTGDGLPNLAPSLRGSSFVTSAEDAAIASVIRL